MELYNATHRLDITISITVILIAGRYAKDGVTAWRLPVCVVS